MDNLDFQILNLLKENSRISVTEISQQIGRSHSATRLRLAKITESGVIDRFTININEEVLDELSGKNSSELNVEESADGIEDENQKPKPAPNPLTNINSEDEAFQVQETRPVIGSTTRVS
tara:strand:- start:178 stop:537 length:360 start_codon:yes stop_codon:yes gene_type:complete